MHSNPQHAFVVAANRGHLTFIGATNKPNAIDPALRRLGRLDREIPVSLPDARVRCYTPQTCMHPLCNQGWYLSAIAHVQEREDILALHSRALPLADDVSLQELAAKCHGYSGADLAAVCREAAMHALMAASPHAGKPPQPLGTGFGLFSPGMRPVARHKLTVQSRPATCRQTALLKSRQSSAGLHAGSDPDADIGKDLLVSAASFNAALCKIIPSLSRGWHTTLDPGAVLSVGHSALMPSLLLSLWPSGELTLGFVHSVLGHHRRLR
jgi:SpoVK/Ycf46/Vps4 family AAA+-type ATPase